MQLITTYLNERLEMFEHMYNSRRHEQLHALLRLYNRRLGPVVASNVVRPELLDLSIYSSYCAHVPFDALIRDLTVKADGFVAPVPAGGKGATMLRPLLGAHGEMAERLLGVLHYPAIAHTMLFASHRELAAAGYRALSPEEMPLFAPEQYAREGFDYVPFSEDTFLGWVEGRDLLADQPILVPAQLVLMYYRLAPNEAPIGYATSAGLAFDTSRRSSILHGFYEVIERDAVNVHWYCQLRPPRVAVDLQEFWRKTFGLAHARLQTPYVHVEVFLNMLDTPIPTIVSLAIDSSRTDRAFLGGAAASSRREEALGGALCEVGQSQTAYHFADPFGRDPIYPDSEISALTEFFDAALWYGFPANAPRLAWYREGGDIVDWADVPTHTFKDESEEYSWMLQCCRNAGLRPIALDFGAAGWEGTAVMKVLVPQLTQAPAPSHPFLGHPRFYELPAQLGRRSARLTFAELNPNPVPLP